MASYQYRCLHHGVFELARPVGTARVDEPCPSCDQLAVRVYSPPLVPRMPDALRAAMDRADASREAPPVVSRIPRGGR